jgi:hypothetical protein
MSFSTAFAGSHRITAEAWTYSGADTGATPLGTWTVPALNVTAKRSCDVNQDGVTDVTDVQAVINAALGASVPGADLNLDGAIDVVDAQLALNAAAGLGCMAGSGG